MGQLDRFRSQFWSFTYLAVRRVLSVVVLTCGVAGRRHRRLVARHPTHLSALPRRADDRQLGRRADRRGR
jgi:hypothetical protein